MALKTTCLISLGGNLEISEARIEQAWEALADQGIYIQQRSSVYRTPAMGVQAGSEFLNAAAIALTGLNPEDTLSALHRVEQQFGRERLVHWGPRTLDLDLILHGDSIACRPDLRVPHPAMWYRRFVLAPAAEVAPHLRHPVLRQTMRQLLDRLNSRPLVFLLDAGRALETRPGEAPTAGLSGFPNGIRQMFHEIIGRLNDEYSARGVQLRWMPEDRPGVILPFAVLQLISDAEDAVGSATSGPVRQPELFEAGRMPGDWSFCIKLPFRADAEQAIRDIIVAALG